MDFLGYGLDIMNSTQDIASVRARDESRLLGKQRLKILRREHQCLIAAVCT